MDPRVVGVGRFAVDAVGVGALLGRDDPLADVDARPDGLAGVAQETTTYLVVVPPGQVNLLGRAIGGRAALVRVVVALAALAAVAPAAAVAAVARRLAPPTVSMCRRDRPVRVFPGFSGMCLTFAPDG